MTHNATHKARKSAQARPHLRTIDASLATVCRRLKGAQYTALHFAERDWHLHFWASASPVPTQCIQGLVHWQGFSLHWHLSAVGLQTLLEPLLGAASVTELDSALRLAVLQDIVEDIFAHCAPALERPKLIIEATPQDGLPTTDVWGTFQFVISPDDEGESIYGWLSCSAETAMQVSAYWTHNAHPQPMLSDWEGLPILSTIELGWVNLPLTVVESLRVRDIVIPDGLWSQSPLEEACLRLSPTMGILVALEADGRVTVRKEISRMEQPPLDQPETLAESSETSEQVDVTQSEEIAAAKKTARPRKSATRKVADELSELPVRMTFDLGEYPLTLRELNAVQVGHVFDLALAPQQAVNLRVNGRLLGEGELVEIDGRIGIAVTRFLAPRS